MALLSRRHPEPDFLRRFAAGSLPQDAAASVATHIANCDSCLERFAALPEGGELPGELLWRVFAGHDTRNAVAVAPVQNVLGSALPAGVSLGPQLDAYARLFLGRRAAAALCARCNP